MASELLQPVECLKTNGVTVSNEISNSEKLEAGHEPKVERAGTVTGWPDGPNSLQRHRFQQVIPVGVHVVLLSPPIMFIALAIIAWKLDKERLSNYGNHVQEASRLGPTIFPIIFGAIVGKTVRSLTLKLAEDGARLGLLEQLLGSQSLAGTISRLIELRSLHIMGIAMIFVWAFSPLGGQSALRLLSIVPSSEFSEQQVSYAQTTNRSFSWISSSDNANVQPAMSALYSAALLGAEENTKDTEDLWGNPKIPFFDELPEDEGTDGWRTVKNGTVPHYSSLIGVRLQGLCEDCKMNIPLQTSYQTLSCKNVQYGLALNETIDFLGIPWSGWSGSRKDPFVSTASTNDAGKRTTFFIGMNNLLTAVEPLPEETFHLFYTTLVFPVDQTGSTNAGSMIYNCTLESQRIEAEIACEGRLCKLHRMRKSRSDLRPANWSPWQGNGLAFNALAQFFPFAAGYKSVEGSQANPTDTFIFDDGNPYNYTRYPDRKGARDEDVSRRLTIALNTIYQATMMPFSIANGNAYKPLKCQPGDAEQPFSSRTWTVVDDCSNMDFATATMERTFEVYKAQQVWIWLLLVSSIILLLLGVINIILQFITTAPDVFGFISSMTRDNPYIQVPAGATGVDGATRARLLRDVKVQLADVHLHEDSGHIALRSIEDDEDTQHGRLKRSRTYE